MRQTPKPPTQLKAPLVRRLLDEQIQAVVSGAQRVPQPVLAKVQLPRKAPQSDVRLEQTIHHGIGMTRHLFGVHLDVVSVLHRRQETPSCRAVKPSHMIYPE
jgi:hypothetical protein